MINYVDLFKNHDALNNHEVFIASICFLVTEVDDRKFEVLRNSQDHATRKTDDRVKPEPNRVIREVVTSSARLGRREFIVRNCTLTNSWE